jgi:hypothetical protein
MGLDIRTPIGALFVIVGLLLAGYGAMADPTQTARSLGINMNLWWGLVMTIFGAIMFWLGRSHRSAMHPSDASAEGQAIEQREHRTGLERE